MGFKEYKKQVSEQVRNITTKTQNFNEALADVTRIEVVDEKGRSYVNNKPTNVVELSVQDNGKTLKVFIMNKNEI